MGFGCGALRFRLSWVVGSFDEITGYFLVCDLHKRMYAMRVPMEQKVQQSSPCTTTAGSI